MTFETPPLPATCLQIRSRQRRTMMPVRRRKWGHTVSLPRKARTLRTSVVLNRPVLRFIYEISVWFPIRLSQKAILVAGHRTLYREVCRQNSGRGFLRTGCVRNVQQDAWRFLLSGNPAVLGSTRRPEVLRPCLSAGLPLSVQCCLYQQRDCRQGPAFHIPRYSIRHRPSRAQTRKNVRLSTSRSNRNSNYRWVAIGAITPALSPQQAYLY